jgi:hydrogenase nickel incorporation protein HypB
MSFKVIKESILKANDDVAEEIRAQMTESKTLMINIISSPGAGKTAFLEKIGPVFKEKGVKFAIITGDCFTSRDAERIDRLNLPVTQINTGNACHIDATLVKAAIDELDFSEGMDLVIVENVGNLVCPAEFDVGEDFKIAFFSTTEGADKPIKYPLLVNEGKMCIINKSDLLEYVDFDIAFCEKSILKLNPQIEIFKTSCKTGEGINAIFDWLENNIKIKKEK